MSTIFDAVSMFWSYLTGYVSNEYIVMLTTISIVAVLYFLIIRGIFCVFRCDKVKKIFDLVFLVWSIGYIMVTLVPEIHIVKEVIGSAGIA